MAENDTKPTHAEPGPVGWYWAAYEDADYLNGPYQTRDEAVESWFQEYGDDLRIELEAEGAAPESVSDDHLRSLCPSVGKYRRPSISCDVFDGDDLCERLEECNETATFGEFPFDPPGEIKAAMARHMAQALYAFLDANDLWKEFRGLEDMGDADG